MGFSSAFQRNAFQSNAFQIEIHISSTDVIQKPINCVLAGDQPYEVGHREFEIPAARRTERVAVTRSRRGRLGEATPSFTIRTDKRGYS